MLILYLDCWNNEPDNRPIINKVVVKLNAIILKENNQLLSEQQNIIKNSLHDEMSQVIQNFSKINIKEIEPSISSNLIIKDFDLIVEEIIHHLEFIKIERK